MATWKDDNEKKDLTLRQVLKQIESKYNPEFDLWNDDLFNDNLESDDKPVKRD